MENKPDTEPQAQNTQADIGPVTATQPPGESPDVVARQHKLAQDYAQVTGKQQPPLYLLIGHEDEFQSEIDEAERIAIRAASPYLDKWRKENPTAAAIADDDQPNLARWTQLGEHISIRNISHPHILGTISSDAVASANGARHSAESMESAPANDGVLVADKSVGKDASAPSEKEILIRRIENAADISEPELEKLIYDIRAQSAINPGIAQTLVYGIRNGDTSREDVRGQLGPTRLSENTAKLIELIPEAAAIVVDDATRVVKYIDGNIDEAFKGSVSSAISSPGYVMEFGSNGATTQQPYDFANKIGYYGSLNRENAEILSKELSIYWSVDSEIAIPILQNFFNKKIQLEEARQKLSSYKSPHRDELSEFLLDTGIFLQEFGEKLLPAEPGMENSPGRVIGESIGSLIIAAIIGVRNPRAGIAYAMAESGGRSASAARKAGQSKEIQKRAAWWGFAAGSVNAVPVGKLAGRLLAQYPMLAHPLARLAGRMLEDGAKNGSQQFLQNTVTHFLYDPEKNLSENVRESVFAGMLFRLGFDSVKAGQTLRNTKRNDATSAEKATQAQPVIDEISNLATTSKLQIRAPEELEKYVAGITKNGPFENVYLDVDKLPELLKGNGISLHDFADGLGVTRSQLDAIINSGGDMKIPTAIYATRVANLSSSTSLNDSIRFGPSAFSGIQAREYYRRINKKPIDARIQPQKSHELVETEGVSRTISSDKPVSAHQNDGTTALADPVSGNSVTRDLERETRKAADTERAKKNLQHLLYFSNNRPADRNTKKKVGRAGDSVAQAVQDTTGFDITKAQHSLNTKIIRDSLHTKHPDPQRQVIQADVEAIPDIISSADRIISGGKNERGQPIIGYIKHMSDGRTLYLEQTQIGPNTFNIDALTKYPAGKDLDAVSQTVLSDVRAKNGDNVKLTPVKKGDAQPLPGEDGKAHALPQENGDVQPLPQDKTGGKRASASEGRSLGGMGAGGITAFSSAGLAGVVGQFTNHIRDMANEGEPTAVTAMARLNDWWGQSAKNVAEADAQAVANNDLAVTDGATILGTGSVDSTTKTAAVDSGLQTQFSRDFQTYMLEGKVPSPELAGTFETARKWLTTAYVNSAAVNGKTSPEVAEVFNRMLVSDGQLEMARLDAGESGPVFSSAEAMGLSEAAYADFTAARQRSEDEASAEMLQSVMQPVRREQDKAYAQEKAAVRTRVEEQVNTEGHYRAIELMSNRRWLGDGVAPANLGDIRFDKAMLVERYGDEILNVLPRGSQTVYMDKDGLDPDDVASIFGYGSGDELLRLMMMAPSRNDRIDGETARIMRERHGDPLYDGTADLKAMDAIHNTSRGQWLETELKAVGRVSKTSQNLTLEDAHISAKATVSDMSVQDAVESNRFLAAERRAAEEAERLSIQLSSAQTPDVADVTATPDDIASDADTPSSKNADKNEIAKKLYTAKRRQLLNHALYVESRAIAREVEEMEAYVQSLAAPERREQFFNARQYDNGLINYNDALNDLLARYDFPSVESAETGFSNGRQNGQLAGITGALEEYIDQMKAAGRENELAISVSVVSATARLSYRKLPLQTFRDVINSLKNLEHSALRAGKLVDVEQTRNFEDTVAGVLSAFAQTTAEPMTPGIGDTPVVGHSNRPRPYFDAGMNAGVALRELDGSHHGGDVQAAIKAPVDAAITRLAARKQKAASELAALYDVYSPEERQDMARRVHVPQLGYSLSKWDMIAIALNTGTAENRRQLMDTNNQDALNQAQVSSVLGYLDARDADFVQSVWDYAGSFNAEIAARETRVTGVAPQWVEATPVVIGGKKLTGGYYPLRGDGADGAQGVLAGRFAKAQTSSHHGRHHDSQGMNEAASPVEFDMSVLHRHINELVHDLELSEPLSNTRRLLQDQRIQMAFIHTGKGSDHAMLQGWLRDAATGDMAQAELVSSMARLSKDNGTATRLAGDLGAALSDSSSLSSAMSLIGHQGFADGLQHVMRPGVLKRITALSPYMAARLQAGDGNQAAKDEPLDRLASWMSQRLQYQMVDAPVWLAAYQQGLQTSEHNEAKAISHADTMVQQAVNSSGNAGGNGGSPNQKEVLALLTALGSFMTAKSHMNQNRQAEADTLTIDPEVNGMSLAVDLVSLFHADAVLRTAAGSNPASDNVSVMEALPFVRDGKSSGGTRNLAKLIGNTVGNEHFEQPEIAAILKATALAHDLPVTQIAGVVDARMQQLKGQGASLLDYRVARSA